MKRIVLPIVIVVLLGAFGYWWLSPTQVLKRRTKSLLETLTLEAGSGRSARHMGGYALNALLAPQVELDSPTIAQANGTFERQEMESAYAWLCDQAKETRFALQNFESVVVNGDGADVTFSLDALVELPSYSPADGRYEVVFHWERDDDQWRLSKARWDAAE
jgi:hypothetical protein